jgi:AcrR family transcriptional regulator/DNA-binding MarR family transcriptional regulator
VTRSGGAAAARPGVDRVGGRSGIVEIQRARLIAAMTQVARERGVGATTVAHVVERSGVSRRTFYELFEDRDDCFRAAFDQAIERAAQSVVPAYESAQGWRERMRAGLRALLEFLDDEPSLGALCVVDVLGAGGPALERRRQVVQLLIAVVDEGRKEVRAGAHPTRLTAEGVVGAVLAVLHERLSSVGAVGAPASDGAPMTSLLGALMGMIVLPYQGNAAATREAAKPAPRRRRATRREPEDPLRALDMRLTYRTVRVLRAIAELGGRGAGSSNRQIAEASDITDQGQISRLLVRLEHFGLVRNDGAGRRSGEPNVWSLTPKGKELERSIRQ